MGIVWGFMANANKVIFWMLLSVISSPNILNRVRQEIELFAKVIEDGKLNLDVNGLINSCPMLKAIFFETLRLYTAGVSYRKVYVV
jgi:cytochrome P450